MESNRTGPMTADNPFFGPQMKSKWAHLSRTGGDRVAILFAELRRRVGAIGGLVEELIFAGKESGWTPTYSLEGKNLFSAHIGAGSLEVAMRMDANERDCLLASGKLSVAAKRALEEAQSDAGEFPVRFAVENRRDVATVAKMIKLRSRLGLKK